MRPHRSITPLIEPLESRMLCSTSPIDVPAAPQPAAAATTKQMLPDLMPWANKRRGYIYGWQLDRNEEPGHLLLRLRSAIANIGNGPLDLRGGAITSNGHQLVYQRIFNANGTHSDRVAGTFTYHPAHHHTHFDDFASYRLRTVLTNGGVGKIVGSGTKTSYCLTDVEEWPKPLAHTDVAGNYFECGSEVQGISVGWADVYDYSLADQWIDITHIKPAKYWLEVVADPRNRVVESNEKNNSTRVLINLRGIKPPPNDNFANRVVLTGTAISTTGNNTLATHETGEHSADPSGSSSVWWAWTAPASGRVTMSTAGSSFDTVLGVYTGDRVDSLNKIARNDDDPSGLQTSKLSFQATQGTTYQISVEGYASASGRIRLSINLS